MIDKSRILLVDDVPENLVALEALLRRADAEILLARSGTEALELVLQHEFALALIDVQMPEMDGFELAELMRGTERSKYIPIIFLTAASGEAQRVFRGYDSGAVDFLFKPVDPHILRQKTDTFIRLDQQRKELAQQYRRLQESEAMLRDAVQARDDVLAVVSHDIRNFLQAIKSGVHLLGKPQDKLGAETRAALHSRISSTVDLMSRVIADLLDITNIRNGRIQVNPRCERAGALIAEAVAVHEPLAQEKGIRLLVHCEAPDATVECDRERILQVLANLLGNAIKFCRSGDQITVAATTNEAGVQIAVCDTGPGIGHTDLPLVFEPYWSGAGHRRNGSGLGLYITKSIIEAHHARIWIESELGRGTRVYFTLLRADAAAVQRAAAARAVS
jgi:two-component system, sensor histidine kinase and response regulator